MAKKSEIFYCKENKRNYFMLGYHFNFSGHIDVLKNFQESERIRKEYNYSEGSMFLKELQVSSRYKYMIVMYSNDKDQKVIEGAYELENWSFWDYVQS